MAATAEDNSPKQVVQNHAWDSGEPPITPVTLARMAQLLDKVYPGKWRYTVEVCPKSVVKMIDNETDALITIDNLERYLRRIGY